MKTVYKFPIQPDSIKDSIHRIELPMTGKPLCVHVQNGQVCVWMEVDTDQSKGTTLLGSVGTGWGAVPENAVYVGTVLQGCFVWHIYWLKNNDHRQ